MAKRRAYSDDGLGPTMERLMSETGLTYRGLAAKTGSRPATSTTRPRQPPRALERVVAPRRSVGVKPEHFREYRLRVITARFERCPSLLIACTEARLSKLRRERILERRCDVPPGARCPLRWQRSRGVAQPG